MKCIIVNSEGNMRGLAKELVIVSLICTDIGFFSYYQFGSIITFSHFRHLSVPQELESRVNKGISASVNGSERGNLSCSY